ncbi:MAG: hypothetical protein V4515_14545 [Chloroflexota bacterium]
MTDEAELLPELLELTDAQRTALVDALEAPDRRAVADHRVLGALRRKRLISEVDHQPTELGRYQVRWFSEDCGRAWGVEAGTFLQYVRRGTAPEPTDKGTFGSSTVRPWWDPRTVLEFERVGSARKGVHRRELSEVDMQSIVRDYRGGVSIRDLARAHSVAVTTLASRLEELGEKPETTATRAERDRRMAGNNPTTWPGGTT